MYKVISCEQEVYQLLMQTFGKCRIFPEDRVVGFLPSKAGFHAFHRFMVDTISPAPGKKCNAYARWFGHLLSLCGVPYEFIFVYTTTDKTFLGFDAAPVHIHVALMVSFGDQKYVLDVKSDQLHTLDSWKKKCSSKWVKFIGTDNRKVSCLPDLNHRFSEAIYSFMRNIQGVCDYGILVDVCVDI